MGEVNYLTCEPETSFWLEQLFTLPRPTGFVSQRKGTAVMVHTSLQTSVWNNKYMFCVDNFPPKYRARSD